MTCPNCSSYNVKVVDTMSSADGLSVYRRKKCRECGAKFRTVEVIDDGSEAFKNGYLEALNYKNPSLNDLSKKKTKRRMNND